MLILDRFSNQTKNSFPTTKSFTFPFTDFYLLLDTFNGSPDFQSIATQIVQTIFLFISVPLQLDASYCFYISSFFLLVSLYLRSHRTKMKHDACIKLLSYITIFMIESVIYIECHRTTMTIYSVLATNSIACYQNLRWNFSVPMRPTDKYY